MALIGHLLDPDTGYKGSHLWLPKSFLPNYGGIKASLTFERAGSAPLYGWDESEDHIILPREYIPMSEYSSLPFDIHPIKRENFPKVKFNATSAPREGTQQRSVEAMVEDGSGMLVLGCGKGKTVVSLIAASKLNLATIVFVNEEGLASQWRQRILEHTDCTEDDVGLIQGNKWDWEGKKIVIAMIQTFASRLLEIDPRLFGYFGIAIYDECHMLGARWFNPVVGLFHGIRWGLSATWERPDGLEEFYRHHLGPILYQDLSTDLEPKVIFVKTHVRLPRDPAVLREHIYDKNNKPHNSRIISWLAQHPARNRIILDVAEKAMSLDRVLLVLGERKAQLRSFGPEFEGSGVITGDVKGDTRESALNSSNPIFAIAKIAKQGLDRKSLDTLMILYPFRDGGRFRQMMGRILRMMEEKLHPLIFIMEDEKISQMVSLCRELRGHLEALGYEYYIMNYEDVLDD